MPLMVTYKAPGGEPLVYAVVEDRHTKWQLQDMDDGRRFEALKIQCRVYDPEPAIPAPANPAPASNLKFSQIPAAPAAPTPPAPAPAPEPTPVPISPLLVTGNQTDWTALVRLTQRRVEGVKIEYEQITLRAAQLKEQYDSALAFLKSLGVEATPIGESIPGLTASQTKRTVLSPSGRGGSHVDYSRWVDRLYMAWVDAGKPSGYGYIGKIKDKIQTQGEEIPNDAVLYRLMKEVYARASTP
jgi:hypothetical protein